MLSPGYQQAVQLLLRLVPMVFASDAFALKGGTAINLYMSAVPRLSVDLDLVFLPLGLTRDEALAAIGAELDDVRERAFAAGLRVRTTRQVAGDDRQLLVSDGETEVKVEVNQVFRGTVLPPRIVSLHPAAEEMFATDVAARLLAPAEVYAGKAVAALDRQHPRDLFDIWMRNQSSGFTTEDLDVFAAYLAGHNRPPHEVLDGRDKPLAGLYETALIGMATGSIPSIEALEETRERLRREVRERMSPEAKQFLMSFFALEPDWTALPFADLPRLPALMWKQRNLGTFRVRRPDEFARQNEELARLLA